MFPSLDFKPMLSGLKRVGLVCLSLAFATPSFAASSTSYDETPSSIDWSTAPWQSVQPLAKEDQVLRLAQAKTVDNLRPAAEGAEPIERGRIRDRGDRRGKACNPFKPEFECDEETGEVIVTLVNSVGSFDADDIAIKVLTPGIILSWPDPTDPLRVRLEGALPGQVIVLETSAVQVGGGSAPGLDKCCMGKIRIKVPRLPCNDDKPKLKVKKSCRKADDSNGGANVICDINIHYSGPAPTAAKPLRLNDVMNGGGAWKILSVLSSHVWSCDAIPHNGPAAFGCQLKSEDQVVPIGWAAFHSFLQLRMKVDERFENCATVSTQSRNGKVQAKDCAKLGNEKPKLSLKKTGPASCVAGNDCVFTITIRNEGAGDFDASTLMMDQMNLDDARILDMSPMPSGCSAEMLGASGFACIRDLKLNAGESASFEVTTRVPANSNARELRNCVGLYRDNSNFEAGGYSVDPNAGIDLPGDVLSILDDNKRLGYDCAEVPLTQVIAPEPEQPQQPQDPQTPPPPPAPQGRPNLDFKKVSFGDCAVDRQTRSYSCEFELTATNVGSRLYEGPLVISEQLGRPRALNLDITNGDGWTCRLSGGSSGTCIQPFAELAPGASSSVTIRVQLPAVERDTRYTNCARLGVGSGRRERVTVAQQAMENLGIDVGGVDGLMGRRTRAGLRELQQQLGLPITGEISDALFERLGVPQASTNRRSCASVTLPGMPRPYVPPVQPDPLPLPIPLPIPPGSVDPLPNCDGVTAVPYRGRCVCRYDNMRKVSYGSCRCRKGTSFVPGQGCARLIPPIGPKVCDRTSTVRRGNKCVCRYDNMRKISATKCVCRKGQVLVVGKGCLTLNPPIKPLKCDRVTTVRKGAKCACRYRNMRQTSATSCSCKKGVPFIPGQGCVSVKPPIVKPPLDLLKCNRTTTVKKGKKCVCRYRGMRKTSPTSCSCKKGSNFVPGQGCLKFKPPIVKPPVLVPPKCHTRTTIRRGNKCVCRKGLKRISATRCAPVAKPPIVKPPSVIKPPRVVPKRCDARSTVRRGNKCVCRKGFNRVSPTRCVPARVQPKPPIKKPPKAVIPRCDRSSTVLRGNKCVCRSGFKRASATRCVPARVKQPIKPQMPSFRQDRPQIKIRPPANNPTQGIFQ